MKKKKISKDLAQQLQHMSTKVKQHIKTKKKRSQ